MFPPVEQIRGEQRHGGRDVVHHLGAGVDDDREEQPGGGGGQGGPAVGQVAGEKEEQPAGEQAQQRGDEELGVPEASRGQKKRIPRRVVGQGGPALGEEPERDQGGIVLGRE